MTEAKQDHLDERLWIMHSWLLLGSQHSKATFHVTHEALVPNPNTRG